MYKRLKELLYTIKVSKKYNLKFKWLVFSNIGFYNQENKLVQVSIFRKEFLQCFMHEIGHHIDYMNGRLTSNDIKEWCVRYSDNNRAVKESLREEAFASKFARRSLKLKDTSTLLRWYKTYTKKIFTELTFNEHYHLRDEAIKGYIKIEGRKHWN